MHWLGTYYTFLIFGFPLLVIRYSEVQLSYVFPSLTMLHFWKIGKENKKENSQQNIEKQQDKKCIVTSSSHHEVKALLICWSDCFLHASILAANKLTCHHLPTSWITKGNKCFAARGYVMSCLDILCPCWLTWCLWLLKPVCSCETKTI